MHQDPLPSASTGNPIRDCQEGVIFGLPARKRSTENHGERS
jgi:hypothetical protein